MTQKSSLPVPAANSLITRKKAVELIVERICSYPAYLTEEKNKISHRIGYAIKTKQLKQEAPGKFIFIKLATWAQSTWPGIFDDWPRNLDVTVSDQIGISTFFEVSVDSDTVEGCRDIIQRCETQLRDLARERDALMHEVETLRPDAQSWRKLRRQSSMNATKNREKNK